MYKGESVQSLSICHLSVLKSPLRIYYPPSLETWNPKEVSSVQHRESLLMCVWRCVITPKSMSQSDFYIFLKTGIFSLFLLSAAACSRGLVVSVWWCNTVTVLLQSSRKASATAFGPTLASNKDTYTDQHHSLSGLTERRRAEAKGGERKCHVLVMKYRTILKAGSGFSPKLIYMQVSRR